MHLPLLQQFFTDEMMRAVCWTLVHSLWQGLVFAFVCAIIILLTRKSSSILRYNLLSILFFLFLLTAGYTFSRELSLTAKNDGAVANATTPYLGGTNVVLHQENLSSLIKTGQSYIQEVSLYLSAHASLVVAIWFIVFSARCVRLFADLGYAHRIRYYKTHQPSPYWQSKIQELAVRLQIKKNILLLESEIAKVPLMTGFLKPVVLFPFGMMMQLPAEHVEAVLLHELAHIKRKDYLVNLAQSFAETIFFFNPAVLWISNLIREERENCCDDIAIHHTKNKKQFVHALVAFQEYNIDNATYALAFPGKKNQLLQRAKRILQNDNKTLNIMQKILLTSGLVIAGLLTVVFAQTHKPKTTREKPAVIAVKPVPPATIKNTIVESPKPMAGVPEEPIQALEIPPVDGVASVAASVEGVQFDKIIFENDTLPKEVPDENMRGIIDRNINGKKYEIVVIHGKVTELYIDNKRIPDNKIPDYKTTIDKIIRETKELSAKARMDAQRSRAHANVAKMETEQAMQASEASRISAEDAKRESATASIAAERSMEEIVASKKEAEMAKEAALEAKEQAEKDQAFTEKVIKGIISDLKNDGIAKDENNISFSLNKDEFIVNNVKQPASVQSKYSDKYLQNNTRLNYSKSGRSSHLSIQNDDK